MALAELIFDFGNDVKLHVSTRVEQEGQIYKVKTLLKNYHTNYKRESLLKGYRINFDESIEYDKLKGEFTALPDFINLLALSAREEEELKKELNRTYAVLIQIGQISFEEK